MKRESSLWGSRQCQLPLVRGDSRERGDGEKEEKKRLKKVEERFFNKELGWETTWTEPELEAKKEEPGAGVG